MDNSNRNLAMSIPAGVDTATYRGVSNAFLIEKMEQELQERGIPLLQEKFMLPQAGTQMFATFAVGNQDDGLSMNIGMTNSNNKSMRVGFAVGAFVWACANLELSTFNVLRKHTPRVFDDLDVLINDTFEGLEREFNYIKQTYAQMKEVELKRSTIGRMLGDMFYTEGILTSKHLNLIKNDLYSQGSNRSLYDFNMAITSSMREDHPYYVVGRHVKTRQYLLERLKELQN